MAEKGMLFTAAKAAMWAGGLVVGPSDAGVFSVDVDSRRCEPGMLFVALKGERVDGHDYLQKAFGAGACGAVVCRGWYESPKGRGFKKSASNFIIVVDDPLLSLQRMAACYMEEIKKPVRIGVTGSNGKTTTKELLADVLESRFRVVRTSGNFNSEIGLPLSVFKINNSHDFAVIEMGINRIGEMDILSEILRPDIVIITNIGSAHIGIFKDRQTIAHEKRRAVSFFNEKNTLFVHEDEEYFDYLDSGHPGKTMKYGTKTLAADVADFDCEEAGLDGWKIRINNNDINLAVSGQHNLENAVCAYAVGRFLGVDVSDIKKGLEKFKPLSGRSEIIQGAVTVVNDCYNSNFESVDKSMDFADSVSWAGRKIYVLADMKELGAESSLIHRKAGLRAAESCADKILFFGEDSRASYDSAVKHKKEAAGCESGIPEFYHTENYNELAKMINEQVEEGDLVLLKGSRSMRLERLLETLGKKSVEGAC